MTGGEARRESSSAAVVGVTLLSALHSSQAREVRRLREWAGRAPERSVPGATAPPAAVRAVPRQTVIGSPPRSRPRYGRSGARHVLAALVGLLVLGGAAAYGATVLDGADNSGNAQGNDDHGTPGRSRSAVTPGNVTVAVLNGTLVPGLAARLRDQIAAAGFKKGAIADFPDKRLAESVVEYAPGHRAEAKAVGRTVGVTRREPVTANARALAGPAAVIVIAGADKAAVEPQGPAAARAYRGHLENRIRAGNTTLPSMAA